MRRSPALGLIDRAAFRESEHTMEPGMKLMLFTDGLPEAHNREGDEFGTARVLEYLQQRAPQNIKEGIEKAEAEAIKAQLEEGGASVELK